MKTGLISASLVGLLSISASGAGAGSLDQPVATPPPPAVPVAPPPPAPLGGDWTGLYAGVQLGYGDIDGTGGADGDDILGGVHAGYDYDFGTFVLGGEVDYDFADIDLNGAASVDSVARLKLRAGYDFGAFLGYVTAGLAEVDTSIGSESGDFYGLGVAYQINDRTRVGAELLEHSFDDINGSGVDADATTFTVRGSISF